MAIREHGSIDGVCIAMVGDLKNWRTIRSLCYLLGKYTGVHIDLVAPPELATKNDIKTYLKRHKVSYAEHTTLENVLKENDVIYQTRIQKERFSDLKEYQRLKGCYVLMLANTKKMKKNAIVMHPLPRIDEINPDLDPSPRAAYFRQVGYGVLVRMALLTELIGYARPYLSLRR